MATMYSKIKKQLIIWRTFKVKTIIVAFCLVEKALQYLLLSGFLLPLIDDDIRNRVSAF